MFCINAALDFDPNARGRQGPWCHAPTGVASVLFHRRGRVGERFHTDGGCVGVNGFTDGGASVRGFTPTGS